MPELKERRRGSACPYTLSSTIIQAQLDPSIGIKC